MNYINIGYDSTNYYALSAGGKYVLIDTGMPGTMSKYKRQIVKAGIEIQQLKYLIITHFHIDHCGIAQDLQEAGVELLIASVQVQHVESANVALREFPGFRPIQVNLNNVIQENDRNGFSKRLGFNGYLFHTPGHSDDSISIVVDGLGIFTGDLPFQSYSEAGEVNAIEKSWSVVRTTPETTIFPGHGNRL